MRVALIWGNNKDAPKFHTHHFFWEAILEEQDDIEWHRFRWTDFLQMPKDFDLYLFIDFNEALYQLDGTDFHPRVLYWWDSFHVPFAFSAQVTEYFDQSYYAEYATATALKSMGYRVEWLPPAFYPGLYRPLGTEKLFDYCFVGQQDMTVKRAGDTRASLLRRLADNKDLEGQITLGIYAEAVNKLYNSSRILFDRTIFYNIGTRLFECVGSGGFFLLNKTRIYNGMNSIGMDGVHFATYEDSYESLVDRMKYYLEHEEERNRIAQQGHKFFLQNHTYQNRLQTILHQLDLGRSVRISFPRS